MTSSDAASSSGTVPSLFTAGMSEEEAQARATSSMTIAVAMASAPGAPVGLGDVHRLKVRLDQRLVHVPGELGGAVDVGRAGRDLVVGQGADGLAERVVLLGQGERREIIAHPSMVDRAQQRSEVRAGPGRVIR